MLSTGSQGALTRSGPRRRTRPAGPLVVALALAGISALAACGAEPEPEPVPCETPQDCVPDPTGDEQEPAPDPRVQAAVEDLAEHQDADPNQVQAGELQEVTWSDGSIGCPEEGMAYTQALVEGHRVMLTLEGEEFAYHGQGTEELFFCDDPIEPVDSAPVN